MPSAVCYPQALDMERIKGLKINYFCPASSDLVRYAGLACALSPTVLSVHVTRVGLRHGKVDWNRIDYSPQPIDVNTIMDYREGRD